MYICNPPNASWISLWHYGWLGIAFETEQEVEAVMSISILKRVSHYVLWTTEFIYAFESFKGYKKQKLRINNALQRKVFDTNFAN